MRESHKIIAVRVGARLKDLRGDLTQSQYAEKLGLKQSQYSRYETGERLAPDAVLEKAARLKGVAPGALFWPGASEDSEGLPEYARAVAELVLLLDSEGLEDVYHYLNLKIKHLSRRRFRVWRQAQRAMETLRRKAG